jgi:DNA-binding NarL/FixJ family response regulator
MTSIRVALVDDHPVVLAGIASLLEAARDVTLVCETKTGEEALELIGRTQPNVAVIDISLPDINGLELARRLSQSHSEVKVLTLTAHEDRAYVQPMLYNGARGYLLKRSAAEELLRAVRAVADGGIYLDPAIAEKAVMQGEGAAGDAKASAGELSPREEQVLKLAACGFSNKEVAGPPRCQRQDGGDLQVPRHRQTQPALTGRDRQLRRMPRLAERACRNVTP